MTNLIQKAKRKYSKDGIVPLLKEGPPYLYDEFIRGPDPREQLAINGGMKNILAYYNPQSFVEIGVAKGDTLRTYLTTCEPGPGRELSYYGFDTFDEGIPDNESGAIIDDPDRNKKSSKMHHTPPEEIEEIAEEYDTPCQIQLFKGNTRDTLPENRDQLTGIDLVYIDGGHSYETVKNDYEEIKPCLREGGIIVLDDLNCEDGVTKFIGELLQHGGRRFEKSADNKYEQIIISPPVFEGNQCVDVIIEL